ncbi:MAG TPA: prepilin-type N-terminal cleavage/methylation domain-containing protein [Candidatus Paceibacterota bacterium]|jgi:prepilin-type N-terminal cleavage/methylation domain-containing protein
MWPHRFPRTRSVRGFTLIELLVVIAIISLLSSVVLGALGQARAKARDARRIADLAQIKTALELYYNDRGYYPASSCGHDCNGYTYSYTTTWDTLATQLAPYITTLPRDPLNTPACAAWGAGCYTYVYGNVGRNTYTPQYDLVAQFETQHPLRCGLKSYRYVFGISTWCPTFTNQLYDAGSGN